MASPDPLSPASSNSSAVKTPENKEKDPDEPELEVPKIACSNFITKQGGDSKKLLYVTGVRKTVLYELNVMDESINVWNFNSLQKYKRDVCLLQKYNITFQSCSAAQESCITQSMIAE